MQHPNFPRSMTNVVPTENAQTELSFDATALGYGRNWGSLRFGATRDFMTWYLVLGAYTNNHTYCSATEMALPDKIASIEILAIIYKRGKMLIKVLIQKIIF